jgi:thymidine kinase
MSLPKVGLHVITGPMFSGKTEELIKLLRRYTIAGYYAKVYRPEVDDRNGLLESRAGMSFPATYGSPQGIDREVMLYKPDVVAVDEAQFFTNDLLYVVKKHSLDKYVIVSGLDKDYRGEPFGPMPQLLALADTVTKLTAICTECQDEASMKQLLDDSRDIVLTGGFYDDKYTARCRIHHII